MFTQLTDKIKIEQQVESRKEEVGAEEKLWRIHLFLYTYSLWQGGETVKECIFNYLYVSVLLSKGCELYMRLQRGPNCGQFSVVEISHPV